MVVAAMTHRAFAATALASLRACCGSTTPRSSSCRRLRLRPRPRGRRAESDVPATSGRRRARRPGLREQRGGSGSATRRPGVACSASRPATPARGAVLRGRARSARRVSRRRELSEGNLCVSHACGRGVRDARVRASRRAAGAMRRFGDRRGQLRRLRSGVRRANATAACATGRAPWRRGAPYATATAWRRTAARPTTTTSAINCGACGRGPTTNTTCVRGRRVPSRRARRASATATGSRERLRDRHARDGRALRACGTRAWWRPTRWSVRGARAPRRARRAWGLRRDARQRGETDLRTSPTIARRGQPAEICDTRDNDCDGWWRGILGTGCVRCCTGTG